MSESRVARSRFTRMNEVRSSYHDYICYLAVDPATGVQAFWYEFVDSESVARQDLGERQLLDAKRVTSPYVLQILEVIRSPGGLIVTTEAAQSPRIYNYLLTLETLPRLKTLLKWFRLACLAVEALHREGVVHGSISLSTCHIKTATGAFKLRLPLTRLSARSIARASLNIDAYKSPERLAGVEDMAGDVWALGVALLELVTRARPFAECATPHELVQAITAHCRPAALAGVADPGVADLVARCLAPARDRPVIADVLAHPALRAVEEGPADEHSMQAAK